MRAAIAAHGVQPVTEAILALRTAWQQIQPGQQAYCGLTSRRSRGQTVFELRNHLTGERAKLAQTTDHLTPDVAATLLTEIAALRSAKKPAAAERSTEHAKSSAA